jgi:hypothetical protein
VSHTHKRVGIFYKQESIKNNLQPACKGNGAPKLLMKELLKRNVNLKLPLNLLARGIKPAIITDTLA